MKGRIVVAVDGPAGSGKSSVSREVALKLGLTYIDSGALYRAVTWFYLERHGPLDAAIDFGSELGAIALTQDFLSDGTSITVVNGTDVSASIRDEAITRNIGVVSDAVPVRNFVNSLLRRWASSRSIIMDGRDIGTVVFPDADVKIYLDASVEVRALRRIKEYGEMGKTLDENEVKNLIIQRDTQDRSRPFGRLVRAEDAIYMDTSEMTRDEVIGEMCRIILDRRGADPSPRQDQSGS
ncbi:MAG: (d)CMP kinase [Spirochaetes bacterium]|nr:(d)CMP kinase [Spirochaetota bacterium]